LRCLLTVPLVDVARGSLVDVAIVSLLQDEWLYDASERCAFPKREFI